MAPTTMKLMTKFVNDVKTTVYTDLSTELEKAGLMSEEIRIIIAKLITKKKAKPRFSGYHMFMKEYRVTVKDENPNMKPQEVTSIVSKAWKTLDEEKKVEYNKRAQEKKDEYEATSETSETSEDSDSASDTSETKQNNKKDEKKKQKELEKDEKKKQKELEKEEKKKQKELEKEEKKLQKELEKEENSDDEEM